MASPQKENGYTSIANELLEKIYSSDNTLREIRIILCVIRFTYGFHRKDAELSVSFIANATGLNIRHVKSTLKNLISKNILIVKSENHGVHSRLIRLNKDYDQWKHRGDQESTTTELIEVTKRAPVEVTESATNRGDQKSTQERKKKTLNKRGQHFSIEFMPKDLNGELFYKGESFYVTKSLVEEFKENLIELSDDSFKIEFYKMDQWLSTHTGKKDYKRFFINWLSKLKPEQSIQKTLIWS